jgi:O-antigen/teichoic acid export membrane protein
MNGPDPIDSKRLIAVNTGIKYASLVIINLTAFFLTPYLIRMLGPTLLGLKTLAYQALQFVGLAHTAMGISYERYAKINYAQGDYAEMNSNLSAGFLVSALAALLFAAGSVVLALFASQLFGLSADLVPLARRVFLLIGFSTALLILTGVWETPAFVTERLYIPELGQLLCTVGAAAGAVVVFECWRPSIVAWVLLSNGLLVAWRLFVMMPTARRILPAFRIGLSLIKSSGQLRELMAFGGMNFLGGIGYLLYYASDSIIISNLDGLGPGKIVYYNVAQRWDPQIRMLVMAFVGTLLPAMTTMVSLREHDRLRATFLRGTRYSLLIGAFPALALAVFAVPFLRHWVGEDFARESAPVLQLIMVQLLLCLPERMAYNVTIATGRMGGPVVAALLCGVLNIVLSIALVRYAGLGLAGVAIGSVLALVLVSGYAVRYALRRMDMSIGDWFRGGCARALLCTVPLLAAGLALRAAWEPANLFWVFVQFGLTGLAYLAGTWAIGLQPGERTQVLALAGRLYRRFAGGAAP